MVREFRLGIVGRCLALQPYMKLSDLYHKQLKKMLEEKDEIRLRVSLAKNGHYKPIDRLKELLTRRPIDGVLFHLNHPALNLPLFIRNKKAPHKLRFTLNPLILEFFFRKKERAKLKKESLYQWIKYRRNPGPIDYHDIPPQIEEKLRNLSPCWQRAYTARKYFNFFLGRLFGLHFLALREIRESLKEVQSYCTLHNVPLYILGAIPELGVLQDQKKRTKALHVYKKYSKLLVQEDVPFYFLQSYENASGEHLYKKDQIHLNEAGHIFLANELYPRFSKWISKQK